jgi:hypothetical protein
MSAEDLERERQHRQEIAAALQGWKRWSAEMMRALDQPPRPVKPANVATRTKGAA